MESKSQNASLSGDWFAALNSTRFAATIALSAEAWTLHCPQLDIVHVFDPDELKISDRLGNTPRELRFADGGLFLCTENDRIDHWLSHGTSSGIDKAERSFGFTLTAVIALIFVAYFATTQGIPALSNFISMKVPGSIASKIGDGSLALLDKLIFDDSQLPSAEKDRLRERFSKQLSDISIEAERFTLNFRTMRIDGEELANAFALPSGDVIVTDAIVHKLNDQQLDAVLLHEIGHVMQRHGLRKIISTSIVSATMVMMFGDVTGLDILISGAPTALINSSYSRDLETEADVFSMHYLHKAGKDPMLFVDALETLTEEHEANAGLQYFSTHPSTDQRRALAESLAGRIIRLSD